ncbi:SUKH-4 family immunity protein [Streptomyces sp. NPDC091266]|uniref:SUKH-4 family immunity protein n=1 Tax=Streptomyces sp. NPDC091266 TaxID=3365978 RepID=UPI00382FBA10
MTDGQQLRQMTPQRYSYESMTSEQAVARILEWWRDDTDDRLVAEVVGAPDSGRSEVLAQVRDAEPDVYWVDATDLTAEDILEQLVTEAGEDLDSLWRRAEWDEALEDADFGDRLIVVCNAHRAGRTRTSAQPGRVVGDLVSELSVKIDAKVVVEADPGEHWLRDRLALRIAPEAPPESSAGAAAAGTESRNPAVTALALAEVRKVPLAIWVELARGFGLPQMDEDTLAALAADVPATLEVADGLVSFRDERVAEALRRSVDPSRGRATHLHLVRHLLSWSTTSRHPRGWAQSGATGRYAALGLAMHAVQAGTFDEVQRNGSVVAHLDQVALLDAANCTGDTLIDAESPAGDAAHLWMSGVDSLEQSEWAAWLHLMSTARGDTHTASAMEDSGISLPWKVRWLNWRPPGGTRASDIAPGPQSRPGEVTWEGRNAVSGQGTWDKRFRVWDAATGALLAGPWSEEVPAAGQAEDLWPLGRDNGLTQPLVRLTVEDGMDPSFVGGTVPVSDGTLVLVYGMGGLFAIDPADPAHFTGPRQTFGEPLLAAFGDTNGMVPDGWDTPRRDVLEALFGARAVRRVHDEELPAALTAPDARHILTEVGLPAITSTETEIIAVDEGLTALSVAELPSREILGLEPGTEPAFYRVGRWAGEVIALEGATGTVYTLSGTSGGDEGATLVATGLGRFVAMLQHYIFALCALTMASSAGERDRIRRTVISTLEDIDESATASGAWTTAFHDAV